MRWLFWTTGLLVALRAWQRCPRGRRDPLIDALIRQAGAKMLPGMEHPDWDLINRQGVAAWRRMVDAERRVRQQECPPARRVIHLA